MKKQSTIKDILEVVIGVAIISFILLKFILIPCEVHGTSMYPTLMDMDKGYSFIITKNFGIDRFDICVIKPKNVETEKLIVKRIIGMPNETIEYKNNVLYIDGESYKEEYLSDVVTEDLKIVLKDDEYYCLGDNRPVSKDSRYYGPFSSKEIVATNLFVFYPFSNFGVKR